MTFKQAIKKALKIKRLGVLAKEIGTSPQNINSWQLRGCLPNTEYTGKTKYASKIQIATGHKVLVEDLLDFVPPSQVIEIPESK